MAYRDDEDGLRARHALLSQIRVATPCDASWDAMAGDDRVRRCGLCDRHVYDLSQMTSAEAIALLTERGERPSCVRLHRRRDGTVITSSCARGVGKQKRRLAVLATAASVAIAAMRWPGADPSAPRPDLPSSTAEVTAAFDGEEFLHGPEYECACDFRGCFAVPRDGSASDVWDLRPCPVRERAFEYVCDD